MEKQLGQADGLRPVTIVHGAKYLVEWTRMKHLAWGFCLVSIWEINLVCLQ